MNEILRLNRVEKYYGSGSVVTKAIDDISFKVSEGEFVGIMGASGSGKSTLLNLISTIDTVSAGNIYIGGQDLTVMKEKRLAAFRRENLGFIFQDFNLLDTMTVEENISLPLSLCGVPVSEVSKRTRDAANKLGITELFKKFPYELSGGQRQRVACARALVTEPHLILADEPTGALDSTNSKLLMKTFQFMNGECGATILMVTHDAVVASYASRILFLKDGRVYNELVRAGKSRKAFFDEILDVTAALGGDVDVR